MEDLTGKQLGPYQIVEPLGEGGMASVYKAYQPSMERYVALKILPRHFASDPEFINRFSQEARVIANLQHPHILPVHDFGEADGYTYLVMRYVEGGTLSAWLKNQTPLSLTKIRNIMSQVGGALDYAHAQGVIHRDVKPGNILVDQWDNCLLTDFGLAKMVESTAHLTQTGGILGTPAYMSPEQGLGQEIDHRSDIYSLGVVLYQMAVGYLPYQAETPMAVVIKHIHDPLPPPRQRDPNLPEGVELVILKALAKNPDDRFATAGDMVRALQSATEAPTVAQAAAPVTRSAPLEAQEEQTQPAAAAGPPPGSTPARPESHRVEAIPERVEAIGSRSKLPWILGGVGVVVLALVAVFLSGVLGNDARPDSVEEVRQPERVVETETDPGPAVEADQAAPEEPVQPEPPAPLESEEAVMQELQQAVDRAYEAGDLPQVLGLLDEAINLRPETPDLYCQRGYALRDLESYGDSAANFEQCSLLAEQQQQPDLQSEARGQMAFSLAQVALMEQDNLDEALRTLDEALQDPMMPGWLFCERAELKLQLEDQPGAVRDFETCREHDDIGEYWAIRSRTAVMELQGAAALMEADFQVALENFAAWAELEPEEPWPQCFLGEVFSEMGEIEQSIAAFERCREVTDDPEAHRWAGTSLAVIQGYQAAAGGDWDLARQAFGEAIALSPEEAWVYCERAQVLMRVEAVDDARRDIQMCLELSGEDVGVREWAEGLLQELEANTP